MSEGRRVTALCLVGATALGAFDALAGGVAVLIGLLVVFPLLAATRTSAFETAVVGVYCLALAAVVGAVRDIPGERYAVTVAIVACGGALAMWIAHLRAERERTASRLRAQNAVAKALAEHPTLAAAAPDILASLGETLGFELGALWETRRPGVLRCLEIWTAPGRDLSGFERVSRDSSFTPGVGLPGRVWASGEAAWIPDVTVDDNFPRAPAASQAGLRGAVAFPIRISGGVRGTIEFFASEVRRPDPEVLGLMTAVGNQIGAAIERRRAEAAIRASEARKTAMFDGALDAMITMNHAGRVVEFNPAAEMMFGRTAEDVLGEEMAPLIIPPSLREAHRRALRRVVETGESRILGERLELTGMRADGGEFPVELTIVRIEGESPLFTGFLRDITERKRSEEERSRAERSQRLLADASQVLASSLDYPMTLRRVTELAVPDIADWCAVDVAAENGSIERVAIAHVDPAQVERAQELQRRYPPDPRASSGPAGVMRTGRSELYEKIPDEMLAQRAQDPEHLELMRAFGINAAMVVPMTARGRPLGALTLASASAERRFDESDLALAEELGRRAAIAVDNSRIFSERSHIARTLQRSLLPPHLPSITGVETAARFRPAGDGNEVGGDFYDLFETGRSWTVAIGDVCGKGADAAAVTALARYTVRATAIQDSRPSHVLGLLNEALLRQRSDLRFCTAACGLLERSEAGMRFHTSIGGHPLPLLLRSDGHVEAVGRHGTLLGVVPDPELHERATDLGEGDALVLYTDGVTEARGPGGTLGPDELERLVASCAGLDAEGIAERVESTAVAVQEGQPRDDIAVVVVRVTG